MSWTCLRTDNEAGGWLVSGEGYIALAKWNGSEGELHPGDGEEDIGRSGLGPLPRQPQFPRAADECCMAESPRSPRPPATNHAPSSTEFGGCGAGGADCASLDGGSRRMAAKGPCQLWAAVAVCSAASSPRLSNDDTVQLRHGNADIEMLCFHYVQLGGDTRDGRRRVKDLSVVGPASPVHGSLPSSPWAWASTLENLYPFPLQSSRQLAINVPSH